MLSAGGGILAGWKPYLYDVAFQKHVIKSAFPGFTVKAHLMLADKNKKATVDGLNQKFFITRDDNGRVHVERQGDITLTALGDPILTKFDVNDIADGIISGRFGELEEGVDFATAVKHYADQYNNNVLIDKLVGSQCAKCEFDCPVNEEEGGNIPDSVNAGRGNWDGIMISLLNLIYLSYGISGENKI